MDLLLFSHLLICAIFFYRIKNRSDRTMMFQAYEAIDDAGEEGLSAAEFAKKLGLNKLDTRSQLKYLEKFDLVDPYMTDSKRQRLTRYVAKRYV